MRLIDAERLDVFAAKCPDGRDVYSFMDGVTAVLNEMDKLPVIDLVLCKDCKEWTQTAGDEEFSVGRCEFLEHDLVMNKGFCAWGVRKDDADT